MNADPTILTIRRGQTYQELASAHQTVRPYQRLPDEESAIAVELNNEEFETEEKLINKVNPSIRYNSALLDSLKSDLSPSSLLAANLDFLFSIIPQKVGLVTKKVKYSVAELYAKNPEKNSIIDYLRLRSGSFVTLETKINPNVDYSLIFSHSTTFADNWSIIKQIEGVKYLTLVVPLYVENIENDVLISFIYALTTIGKEFYAIKPLVVDEQQPLLFLVVKNIDDKSIEEIQDLLVDIEEEVEDEIETVNKKGEKKSLTKIRTIFTPTNSIAYDNIPESLFNYISTQLKGEKIVGTENITYKRLYFLWNIPAPAFLPERHFEQQLTCSKRKKTKREPKPLPVTKASVKKYEEKILKEVQNISYVDYRGPKTKGALVKDYLALDKLTKVIKRLAPSTFVGGGENILKRWLLTQRLLDAKPQDDLIPTTSENAEIVQQLKDEGFVDSQIKDKLVSMKEVVTSATNVETKVTGVQVVLEVSRYKVETTDLPPLYINTEQYDSVTKRFKGNENTSKSELYALLFRYSEYLLFSFNHDTVNFLGEQLGTVVELFVSPLVATSSQYYSLFGQSDNNFGSSGHILDAKNKLSVFLNGGVFLLYVPPSDYYAACIKNILSDLENSNADPYLIILVLNSSDQFKLLDGTEHVFKLAGGVHTVIGAENDEITIGFLMNGRGAEEYRIVDIVPVLTRLLMKPTTPVLSAEEESIVIILTDEKGLKLLEADIIRAVLQGMSKEEKERTFTELGSEGREEIIKFTEEKYADLKLDDDWSMFTPGLISAQNRLQLFRQFLIFSQEASNITLNYWYNEFGYKPESSGYEQIATLYDHFTEYLKKVTRGDLEQFIAVITA